LPARKARTAAGAAARFSVIHSPKIYSIKRVPRNADGFAGNKRDLTEFPKELVIL
jgi:hypothetical protein